MSGMPRRRFWSRASVRAGPEGHGVRLDARPLNTPAGAPLVLPTAALAQAIADEWNALEGEIDPDRLPLTRFANSAIDRVVPARDAVIEAIAAFGASDLLCYRADAPAELRARQAAAWDPWLTWCARDLGAPLIAVFGLMPHPQPDASLAALRESVAAMDAFELAALHEMVVLSGSLVLALAVARGALAPEQAWQLSRLDEIWQAEHWGLDAEAEAAATRKQTDFHLAAMMMRNLSGSRNL
ncbi:MAG TPA: ATP12 family protein [Amaricoccus sp.]|uniref:ATP12 family chaperone protein n=1 Tax=Amaricoccus sp. TaxID=1872485 RepID=UPI002CF528FE|nr:ATP12 family protein [Amaricoccus sp.]HMQ93329.1 ATP12 family protein [Amaricoccus sp.]HMR54099.1 ATP12 family protein [Amaricoccus sp.]HMR60423.1 ATP12 family protein [Amaricoccus sp.]HMU01116.1 ATP12 family protein [Amaricoccus sp.]